MVKRIQRYQIPAYFVNPRWKRILTASKIGYCDGRKIASLKCHLFATLRPVYFGGKTIWLCGRCIEKLKKKRSIFTRPIPRY